MSADYSDTLQIQKRLSVATERLKELAPALGYAKTVRAYDSDRRKQLLSECVVKAFTDGANSAAEAEHRARASATYRTGLEKLRTESTAAESTIAEYDAESAAWDTCRSLLAVQRETLRQIPT